MNGILPSHPKRRPSSRNNDDSSVEDYEDIFLDVEEGDADSHHLRASPRNVTKSPSPYSDSSANTTDWAEPETWIPNMAENSPVSNNTGNSSETSPMISTNNQEPFGQTFTFNIPDDQSLSSISDVLQVEKDFMEYVMSFPTSISTSLSSPLAPQTTTMTSRRVPNESNAKVGLDHLDNLCKLMEQLSDLKEANIKLKRRVQYLEDIKTLHEIHKEMVGGIQKHSSGLSEDEGQHANQNKSEEIPREPSEESHSGNVLVEPNPQNSGLYRSKTAAQIESASDYKFEHGHKSRSVFSTKERRERSKSVGHSGHPKPKKRPSRWSKVKEVLGIEKTEDASPEKSDEECLENYAEAAKECERYYRKDSEQLKPYKLSTSRSHNNILSSRSFSETQRQNSQMIAVKKCGTLDFSKSSHLALERSDKEEIGSKKSPKTPWGKMKTMIQMRRDNRQQKSESSSSSPKDAKPINGHSEVINSSRRNQRPSHRSNHQETEYEKHHEDRHAQNGKNGHYVDRNFRHQEQQRHERRKSWNTHAESESKFRNENNENVCSKESYNLSSSHQPPHSKENIKRKKSKPHPLPLHNGSGDPSRYPASNEIEERYAFRSPGVSPLVQRKWVWSKVKDVLKGKREGEEGPLSLSVPSSPSSVNECLAFDFDLDKTNKEDGSMNSEVHSTHVSESGGMDNPLVPLTSSSPSTTVSELLRELQQNLSDDFNKKLDEWQKCRAEGLHKVPTPDVQRKDSFGKMKRIIKPEKKLSNSEKLTKSNYHVQKKDMSWLDKEHQKVEREIVRLTKEKQKFEKRAARLKHLKETMMESEGKKKEVLVKTSAGEFRFEGISDAFTKKLYEWETKKGVNPELSTIALLDESLKPQMESSSPLVSNSTRPSPEPKNCYQISRASSEPDLSSAQKDVNSNAAQPATRSKSGDTLLSSDKEVIPTLEEEQVCDTRQETRDVIADDNYYSLLEENMYLLDQLKEKEEICSHLQSELDRLDEKTEKTNRIHQEEMEKYRQKLWEIHMSRPRDLQGSLQLISELKARIEELQKCSDKLKCDREKLEESFRYHSNQQARLAEDLIRRIHEFQETGLPVSINHGGSRRKSKKIVKCDANSVVKIHELSTKLLQQARDVEQTLMERSRQVCHLRWELLHRDMSAVLLQAALHRVTSQGEPVTILPTWDKRRNKFKNLKAWSVDTTTRRPSEDLVTDDWLQERLRQLSMTPYTEWASIDFTPNDLMNTAHELKRETLRLSISGPDRTMSDSEEKKSATCSVDSEIADSDRYYDTGSAVNSRSSSFSSGPSGLRGSHSDTRLYERVRNLRRNSSSSMSCVEASDSSSMHDSDKMHCFIKRFPWRTQWRSLDNMSSSCSSRSSVLEDEQNKNHWRSIRSSNRTDTFQHEEPSCSHLQLKYGSFKEIDEEREENRGEAARISSKWGSECLITPTRIHLASISDIETDPSSEPSHSTRSIAKSSESFLSKRSLSKEAPQHAVEYFEQKVPPGALLMSPHRNMDYESHSEQNASYKSATEGSMESLDKYETAIRDEELTTTDRETSILGFGQRYASGLESFSDFEEDLKQRITHQTQHHEVPHPSSSSQFYNSISDYIYRDKRFAQAGESTPEINLSTPGSPNISKYKYKGTKGFGRPPHLGYKTQDRLDFKSFNATSSEAYELSDDKNPFRLDF